MGAWWKVCGPQVPISCPLGRLPWHRHSATPEQGRGPPGLGLPAYIVGAPAPSSCSQNAFHVGAVPVGQTPEPL